MVIQDFYKNPSIKEFIKELREVLLSSKRPPDEIILDETDICNLLHISKRHAADLRKEGKIKYSKDGGKIYYLLAWVLEYISNNQVEIPQNKFNKIT